MSLTLSRAPGRGVVALLATVMLAGTLTAIGPAHAGQPALERLWGEDRFATAAAVATEAYPAGAAAVILAAGFNFPDALAANGAAGALDAPILLVNDRAGMATGPTLAALEELSPDTVYVAGGLTAVEAAIEREVADAGQWEVTRFAGEDRFATAALMAAVFAEPDTAGVAGDTAIIATGRVAADSLTAGPLAHTGPHPLLLTDPAALPSVTADALEELSITDVLVLGGEAAVSPTVVDAIADIEAVERVTRVAGGDRFETAVEIARELGATGDEVLLAPGFGRDGVPADALAGGPYGGVNHAPVLPINDVHDALDDPISAYLGEQAADIDTVTVLGGQAAVSAEVASAARTAAAVEFRSNQTFTVDPEGLATVTEGDEARVYTVSDPLAHATHRIVLFDADNVNVAPHGEVTFTAQGDSGDAATRAAAGTVNSHVTVVNGTSVAADTTAVDVEANGGEITFAVEGRGFDSVVPVVYVSEDDGHLVIDADGAPVEEAPFGIGGQLDVLPAEAASDAITADSDIAAVNKVDRYVVVDVNGSGTFALLHYDDGDVFYVDEPDDDVDGAHLENQTTLAQFEAVLTVGDNLSGESDYSREATSTFVLNNVEPQAPEIDAVATSDTSVEVTVDGVTDDATVRVYVAEQGQDFADATLGALSATDEDEESAGFHITLDGLAPESDYVVWATQDVDGEESSASAGFAVTTLEEGQTSPHLLSQAAVVTVDGGLKDEADGGDEWQVGFNRVVDEEALTGGQIVVEDGDGSATTVEAAEAEIDFSLNVVAETFVGEVYGPGELLTVTFSENADSLTDDVDDTQLSYPLQVVNTADILEVDDGADRWNLEESADVELHVDTSAGSVDDIAPFFATAAIDVAGDHFIVDYSEHLDCGTVGASDFEASGATDSEVTAATCFKEEVVISLVSIETEELITVTASEVNDVADLAGNQQSNDDSITVSAP